MKVRQDAWSHEDDLLLAETVLRYIREGGTQLAAFEEVGDKLNRTSAACGFRWNAEVRKKYEQAISIAKKQRKEKKRAMDKLKKEKEAVLPEMPPMLAEVHFEKEEQPEAAPAEYSTELVPSIRTISLDDCINFLTNLKTQDMQSGFMKVENERLKQENKELLDENKKLEAKLKKLAEQQEQIQEDYQALVQIMDRARRMVLFEENETRTAPTFRMDKNGNLEQIGG